MGEFPEIPERYFPERVGPGSWDPATFRAHAEACQRGLINEYPIKSWLALVLVDAWEALERIAAGEFGLGTSAQSYAEEVLRGE
jgi:hypothetical protein